jgi:hypothetical protein
MPDARESRAFFWREGEGILHFRSLAHIDMIMGWGRVGYHNFVSDTSSQQRRGIEKEERNKRKAVCRAPEPQ